VHYLKEKRVYRQPQSYADMFAQAKTELFKQVDQYFNHKVKEYEQNLDNQAYYHLHLSRDEFYYLSCILGHLVPAGKISKSLLDKVSLDELDCSDFDKVLLSTTEIKLNEENV
jgi:hypothetical protein